MIVDLRKAVKDQDHPTHKLNIHLQDIDVT